MKRELKIMRFLFFFLMIFILFIPALFLVWVYRKRVMSLKGNEHVLLERASRDGLTNLLNRSAAESMISQIILDADPEALHALFMIDLDNFKGVNDTYGHHAPKKVKLELT